MALRNRSETFRNFTGRFFSYIGNCVLCKKKCFVINRKRGESNGSRCRLLYQ
ncbi:hypothetical protein BLAHAN_06431 [Blautia hansenii DSM 20583]|uniref:Uncharacterized protein n=1 Tax=Blautia hansenii DSM 20583 TaxID=537007 RepID=C9LAI1_BLAHA|nr:hypothetical protein BLAHAN_06431 [Blautia hansenii DSM 20583]